MLACTVTVTTLYIAVFNVQKSSNDVAYTTCDGITTCISNCSTYDSYSQVVFNADITALLRSHSMLFQCVQASCTVVHNTDTTLHVMIEAESAAVKAHCDFYMNHLPCSRLPLKDSTCPASGLSASSKFTKYVPPPLKQSLPFSAIVSECVL
jgi:hypothetical protein